MSVRAGGYLDTFFAVPLISFVCWAFISKASGKCRFPRPPSVFKKSALPLLDQQFHPRRQNFPGCNRFVAPRVISSSPVALPSSGLVLRYLSDSAATEQRRRHL